MAAIIRDFNATKIKQELIKYLISYILYVFYTHLCKFANNTPHFSVSSLVYYFVIIP